MPWYAAHRDLAKPDFCDLAYYVDVADLRRRFAPAIARAEAVIVGSYVPDGIAVVDLVLGLAPGAAFYDIDTPVTLAGLARGEATYVARRQIPRFGLYLSFSGGPMLERLRTEFGARRAAALYCSVDETRYRPVPAAPRWDLGYIGTYSPDRQPALERLLLEPARRLPGMRFVVAGPQYPDAIGWPANVERIAHLPPAEHAAFYGRQRFTLNLTRVDMARAGWSPSVRLFEAAACGTPILSDPWDGLDELFPDREAAIVVRAGDDVVAALTGTPEPARRAMTSAARSRVLARHTGSARARELLLLLEDAEHKRPQGVQAVMGVG